MSSKYFVVVSLAAVVIVFLYLKGCRAKSENSGTSQITQEKADSASVFRGQILDGVYWDEGSDFHRKYGTEKTTIKDDLKIMEGILEHAVILVKDFSTLPLADNRDFTKLFTGSNKQKFAWIHPDHPFVNQEGEIVDRFGAPLFFHRTSALKTEVRSAGEDRQMWTSDDVFLGQD